MKLDNLEQRDGLDNQTSVDEIVRELLIATNETNGLRAGNLNASLQVIDRLGNLQDKSDHSYEAIKVLASSCLQCYQS